MARGSDTGHARDYVAIAEAFAREAARDRYGRRHCRWVRLAAKRHLEDLKRQRRRGWGYVFDPWYANDICDFAEKLPHVKGRWDDPQIRLEPAQCFMLTVIFGWRRKEDRRFRRFTAVYIEMARKGAKSTLAAIVALYCLTCEDEPGPEIIVGATTGDQANKVFQPAREMVLRTAALRDAFGVRAWARSITCDASAGFVQPINAKASTQDGWNPYVGILDELHAHKTRALYDVIRSAFGSRRSPLLWIITTAGYNTTGICYEQRSFVTKVLQGALEADHYFGVIFSLDEKDDPYDEARWVKANPMLGITPSVEDMRAYAKEAQANPGTAAEFKTKRLNLWLNAASGWLSVEKWKACADPTLGWEAFDGLDCWIGGDLADKDDLTALVLAAFDAMDRLIFKPMFWLPRDVLDLAVHAEGAAQAPYRTWHEQGWLQLTKGDWVDHNVIEAQVRAWIERYRIRRFTVDQFAAAQAMASRLNEEFASDGAPIAAILHKKASAVTDAAKEIEARHKAPGRMRHDGNPVMTWMAGNVVVRRRADGTLIPLKETPTSPAKIDGIDALVNAIQPALAVEAPEVAGMLPDDYQLRWV